MNNFEIAYVTQGGVVKSGDLTDLRTLEFETLKPVRRLVSKPRAGRTKVPVRGCYWFAQTGRMVDFESILEMFHLVLLDHLEQVVTVVAQPFYLTDGESEHFPDYWIRFANGECMVLEAKRRAQAEKPEYKAKFAMTRHVCELLGWRFEVRHELPETYAHNLRLLARYRGKHVQEEPYASALLALCETEPRPICFLMNAVGHRAVVLPVIYRLLWQRRLHADLHASAIDHATLVRGGSDVR